MRPGIGQTGVSDEDLHRLFDGELTGADAQELAAQIEGEPELRRELEQLSLLRGLVTSTLERKAEAVPEARFEQIWDEIDRAIERDAREVKSEGSPMSFWSRVWVAVRPLRVPAIAAAGAAAVAVFVMRFGPTEDTNKPMTVASEQEPAPTPEVGAGPASQASDPMPSPSNAAPSPTQFAAKQPGPSAASPEEAMPAVQGGDAEIHSIEFSGNGHIAHTGTVTVLYVEDEQEPDDSERSL